MREPEASTNGLWPFGGAAFYFWVPNSRSYFLFRRTESSPGPPKEPVGWGWEGGSHMRAHALGMLPPPPNPGQPRCSQIPLSPPLPLPQSTLHPARSKNEATRLAQGHGVTSRARARRRARRLSPPGFRVPARGGGPRVRAGGQPSVCPQTYLQHPGGHHPAHVGLDVLLHAFEVGALGEVALLDGEQVLQNAVVVEQVAVRHSPADAVHLAAHQLHGQAGARSVPCALRNGKVLRGGRERVPLTAFLGLTGVFGGKVKGGERSSGRRAERAGRWRGEPRGQPTLSALPSRLGSLAAARSLLCSPRR